MTDINTENLPQTAIVSKNQKDRVEYPSRTKAVLAGMKRGAKFGGKLMGIIMIVLALLLWAFIAFTIVYRWLYRGVDLMSVASDFYEKAHPLQLLGLTIVAFLCCTLWAAIFGALIMGTGNAITYKKSKNITENSDDT